MVMALHRAGLRVGMDVVYNHTSAAGQNARSVLDRIVPGYYQRLNASGDVESSRREDQRPGDAQHRTGPQRQLRSVQRDIEKIRRAGKRRRAIERGRTRIGTQ